MPVLEDDRRWRPGPAYLVESKLRSPSARPGIVVRTALVERLLAAPAAPVICVSPRPGTVRRPCWPSGVGAWALGSDGSRSTDATTMVPVAHAHHTAELIPTARLVTRPDQGHISILTEIPHLAAELVAPLR